MLFENEPDKTFSIMRMRGAEVNCVFVYCILNESRGVAIGLFDLGGRPNWKMLPVKKGTACWVGPSFALL